METAGVTDSYIVIAQRLFGMDAFRDAHVPRPIVREELSKLISSFAANIWNKVRRSAVAQYKILKAGQAYARTAFEGAYEWFEHFVY